MTVVAHPVAAVLVVGYLSPLLPGVLVAARTPRALPDQMVRVWRSGGTRWGPVHDDAQVTFTCQGVTELGSEELARDVRALIAALDVDYTDPQFGRVTAWWAGELLGPAEVFDTPTGRQGVQQTHTIRIRGTVLGGDS